MKFAPFVFWLIFGLIAPAATSAQQRRDDKKPTRFNISVTGSSGLVRAVSPYVVNPARAGLGFGIMNFDRDPGDIDFVEGSIRGAFGLPGRIELFFATSPRLRSNSVNLDPARFPVPPLDLVLDTFPTPAVRSQPYFLFAQEVPYKSYYVKGIRIKPPGHGAFASSSGDTIVGLKTNLLSEHQGNPLALGLQVYWEFPSERPAFNDPGRWRKKAGVSGKRDFGVDALLSKEFRGVEVLINGGYKKIGDPDRGIRVQLVNSGAVGSAGFLVGPPIQYKLDLKDELRVIAGTALPAFHVFDHQVWLIAEFFHRRLIGSATKVERFVNPVETVLGLQFSPKLTPWFSVGAAWLMNLNAAGNGGQRHSPFISPEGKGDINFSALVDPATAALVQKFLSSRGLTVLEGSSRIFATNNPAFDEWRNIPTQAGPVISRGHGAAILFITVRR